MVDYQFAMENHHLDGKSSVIFDFFSPAFVCLPEGITMIAGPTITSSIPKLNQWKMSHHPSGIIAAKPNRNRKSFDSPMLSLFY